MLKIYVPPSEWFNQQTNEFVTMKGGMLKLEHSLLSISEWESKWKKPFLLTDPEEHHTNEEMIDYVRCMTLNKDVDESIYLRLNQNVVNQIEAYINDPHTATVFSKTHDKPNSRTEFTTSELIYYWMVELGIPFECQKWHLNRLLTLIRIISIKRDSKNNKMSNKDILKSYASTNARRRAAAKAKRHR